MNQGVASAGRIGAGETTYVQICHVARPQIRCPERKTRDRAAADRSTPAAHRAGPAEVRVLPCTHAACVSTRRLHPMPPSPQLHPTARRAGPGGSVKAAETAPSEPEIELDNELFFPIATQLGQENETVRNLLMDAEHKIGELENIKISIAKLVDPVCNTLRGYEET